MKRKIAVRHLLCRSVLTGALIIGAPVLIQASVFQSTVPFASGENAGAEVTDHSGEGQISRPSYEISSGPGTEGFVDDSTDNTYGYYTIMGSTTVTLEQMTDQYENQGAAYPSQALREGGAESIEEFCRIILEEAALEGVRGSAIQFCRIGDYRRRSSGTFLPGCKNRHPRPGTAPEGLCQYGGTQ